MIFRNDWWLTKAAQLKLEVPQSGNTSEWNFVCITRDSSSGKTDLFFHGKRSVTANKLMFPGKTLKKGGRILLAGRARHSKGVIVPKKNLPLTISQVNVWDRKLTSDEITAMYGRQKCDGGAGNILDWEDFKNELVLSKFTKADQSQCTSMPESTF